MKNLFGDSIDGNSQSGAIISDCGKYRYRLWRVFGYGQTLNYLMLNPSTADATKNDPTIRVCMGRAQRLGYGRIIVTNLFAYRATYPTHLLTAADPIGSDNDDAINIAAAESDLTVCAWGAYGSLLKRGDAVRAMLPVEKLRHLGLTNDGQPRHPLRVPYSQSLLTFATTS